MSARSFVLFLLMLCSPLTHAENIGRTQQPLINGTLVPVEAQRERGLVTLTNSIGTCSGTLINQSWVLTADHCVTTNGQIGGPAEAAGNLQITATWSRNAVTPTRVVRNWVAGGRDIALVQLGAVDFGKANVQLLFVDQVDEGMRLTKYGRGIFAYARFDGTTAVPAQSDGRYRSGMFGPANSGQAAYRLPANASGQVAANGDSGGPDFVVAANGVEIGIAGVTSSCSNANYLQGMPANSAWITGFSSCTSAALFAVRHEIVEVSGEGRQPCEEDPSRACAPAAVGTNDFNLDGHGDILWYNSSTGESQLWFMNDSSRVGRATISDGAPALIGPPWRIVGSRDFDGDGRTDLLWYNSSSGETQIWKLNGAALAGRATVLGENGQPALIGPPWSIVGTSDVDGNGKSDIVWYNSASGETQFWLMNGHRVAGRATVLGENGAPVFIGPPWSIVGTADVRGHGNSDLVWYNAASGETQIWHMSGHRLRGRETVRDERGNAVLIGPPFSVATVNAFNRDNSFDILWHNANTGESQIWFLRGAGIVRRATVDARFDGGDALVGVPWTIMRH